ncbi:MAG: hypothetical protein AAF203_09390, partial [Pseudomonadota bacterium]
MSETHGPINPKTVLEEGRIDRQYSEGILAHKTAFIDEIFDGRANAQRNILGVLAERQHSQGGHIEKGITETVIAATNRFMDEVYEKAGDDGPRALFDRFAFNVYVSGEFEDEESYVSLIQTAKKERPAIPDLSFADLDKLQGLVGGVEIPDSVASMLSLISYRMKAEAEAMEAASIADYKKKQRAGEDPAPPYRSTKYHSPRTLYKAAAMLKAIVVYDYAMNGGQRPLTANFKDLEKLEVFFTLNGPNDQFVNELLDRTTNPYERSQLSAILQEREMFREIYTQVYGEVNEYVYRHALAGLIGLGDAGIDSMSEGKKAELYTQLVSGIAELKLQMAVRGPRVRQSEMTGEVIGERAVLDALQQMLIATFGPEQFQAAQAEIAQATETIIAEMEARQKAETARLEALQEERSQIAAEKEGLEAQLREKTQEVFGTIENLDPTFQVTSTNHFEKSSDFRLFEMPNGEKAVYVRDKGVYGVGENNLILSFQNVSDPDFLDLIQGNKGGVIQQVFALDNEKIGFVTGQYLVFVNKDSGMVESQQRIAVNQASLSTYDPATKVLYTFDPDARTIQSIDFANGNAKEVKEFSQDIFYVNDQNQNSGFQLSQYFHYNLEHPPLLRKVGDE